MRARPDTCSALAYADTVKAGYINTARAGNRAHVTPRGDRISGGTWISGVAGMGNVFHHGWALAELGQWRRGRGNGGGNRGLRPARRVPDSNLPLAMLAQGYSEAGPVR